MGWCSVSKLVGPSCSSADVHLDSNACSSLQGSSISAALKAAAISWQSISTTRISLDRGPTNISSTLDSTRRYLRGVVWVRGEVSRQQGKIQLTD
jgi:hypothetical protein